MEIVLSRSVSKNETFQGSTEEFSKKEANQGPTYQPCIWKICSFRRWRVEEPSKQDKQQIKDHSDNSDLQKAIKELDKILEMHMSIIYSG